MHGLRERKHAGLTWIALCTIGATSTIVSCSNDEAAHRALADCREMLAVKAEDDRAEATKDVELPLHIHCSLSDHIVSFTLEFPRWKSFSGVNCLKQQCRYASLSTGKESGRVDLTFESEFRAFDMTGAKVTYEPDRAIIEYGNWDPIVVDMKARAVTLDGAPARCPDDEAPRTP